MNNKLESNYIGPTPSAINPAFKNHTYDLVTCLITGDQKSVIRVDYLRKHNYTKEEYLEKFPDAPLMSCKSRDVRSNNMTQLNLTSADFQIKRKQGVSNFWESDCSDSRRQAQSALCTEQHKNGLEDNIREYFNGRYIGSKDQKNRSIRFKENNPSHNPEIIKKGKQTWLTNHNANKHFIKNKFRNTELQYQSGLEYKFLQACEKNDILHRIKNAPTLNDKIYPRQFYVPDFLLDDQYIIEIKSWYIEEKQFSINPLVNIEKQELVIRAGYKWLYIKDNDLAKFLSIVLVGAKQITK